MKKTIKKVLAAVLAATMIIGSMAVAAFAADTYNVAGAEGRCGVDCDPAQNQMKDNGDGTYEVTTTPGYVFEITVEPNKEIAENVIIGECIGKGENLSIGIRVVKNTTNSIEIEVVRAEGVSNIKYSIKKQGEEYGAAEEKSETRHVFSGLTQGGIYTIKVETTKDGKQQIVEKTVQVGEIPLAIEGDVIWKIGQAEVRI